MSPLLIPFINIKHQLVLWPFSTLLLVSQLLSNVWRDCVIVLFPGVGFVDSQLWDHSLFPSLVCIHLGCPSVSRLYCRSRPIVLLTCVPESGGGFLVVLSFILSGYGTIFSGYQRFFGVSQNVITVFLFRLIELVYVITSTGLHLFGLVTIFLFSPTCFCSCFETFR